MSHSRSFTSPPPVSIKRAIRDISVLSPLTPQELADAGALSARADSLFASGAFTSLSEAQHFTALLAARTRGDPLAPSMEAYLAATEESIGILAGVEALRDQAFAEQSARDQAVRNLDQARAALSRELHFKAELERFVEVHIETYILGGKPNCTIFDLIQYGNEVLGARETIRLQDSIFIPRARAIVEEASSKSAAFDIPATAKSNVVEVNFSRPTPEAA